VYVSFVEHTFDQTNVYCSFPNRQWRGSYLGCAIRTNRLLSSSPTNALSLNPHEVLQTGATDVWTRFSNAVIPVILQSYLEGLHLVFILAIALGGISFVVGLSATGGKLEISHALGIEGNVEGEPQGDEGKKRSI
jgi:hypothetical protein